MARKKLQTLRLSRLSPAAPVKLPEGTPVVKAERDDDPRLSMEVLNIDGFQTKAYFRKFDAGMHDSYSLLLALEDERHTEENPGLHGQLTDGQPEALRDFLNECFPGGDGRRMVFEPYSTIMSAYVRLYPDKPVPAVVLEPMELGLGCAMFPDDGSDPMIALSPELPLIGACDILCHELAHVANPPGTEEDEHGPLWQASYDAIVAEYERIMEASGGEAVTVPIPGVEALEAQGGAAYSEALTKQQKIDMVAECYRLGLIKRDEGGNLVLSDWVSEHAPSFSDLLQSGAREIVLQCVGLPSFLVREAGVEQWTEVEAALGFLAASQYLAAQQLTDGARLEVKCSEGFISRWRVGPRGVEEAGYGVWGGSDG